jgi:hypothetical protein
MLNRVFVTLALLAAGWCETSRADVVTDFTSAALDAVVDARTTPPQATRVFAMLHAAMFDAVNGIEQRYTPYFVDFSVQPPPEDAGAVAAAAEAGYTVLVELYPEREPVLERLRNRYVRREKRKLRDDGVAWGRFCGEAMLTLRAADGSDMTVSYTPTVACGSWQPTPAAYAPALLPQWGYVTPFCMDAGDQFRVPPPPDCASEEYALAFMEVKELGAVDSESRTRDETEIAYFWEDGAGSVTPPGHWQLIAQELAHRNKLELVESARLFALLSITQADAAICAWDAKFYHDHWRPVTAIAMADLDENDLTDVDADWAPLLPTPPFPAYTSGHSNFSGSSAELMELFFDDRNISLRLRAPRPVIWREVRGAVRRFDSLREAAEEAGQSRIYGGIHWQYDNQQGLQSGQALAQFVFANFLLPLPN